MIVLDTSVLVHSMTGPRLLLPALEARLESGDKLLFPTLVLYEWLRGPRLQNEIDNLNRFIVEDFIVPFGPAEAKTAAELYLSLSRARSREIDIGIAACAIVRGALLWTLNPRDFADIPSLRLYRLP